MNRASTGFTLLELLVVIAIAGVLTGLAMPSFRATIVRAESRAAATSFYSALTRARSEAIVGNADVSVCARDVSSLTTLACATGINSTAWSNGWIVYAGNTPTNPIANAIQVQDPLPNGLGIGAVTSPFTFNGAGQSAAAALTNFDVCRTTLPDANGRRITVSRNGRVSLGLRPC